MTNSTLQYGTNYTDGLLCENGHVLLTYTRHAFIAEARGLEVLGTYDVNGQLFDVPCPKCGASMNLCNNVADIRSDEEKAAGRALLNEALNGIEPVVLNQAILRGEIAFDKNDACDYEGE